MTMKTLGVRGRIDLIHQKLSGNVYHDVSHAGEIVAYKMLYCGCCTNCSATSITIFTIPTWSSPAAISAAPQPIGHLKAPVEAASEMGPCSHPQDIFETIAGDCEINLDI